MARRPRTAEPAQRLNFGPQRLLALLRAYEREFSIRSHRRLVAHREAWDDKPQQRRATFRGIPRAQPMRRSMARLGLRKPGF